MAYSFHNTHGMPPAAHRGISPALSTRSGIGGFHHHNQSGYDPSVYQGGPLRTSQSPAPVRMREHSVSGASYNPQQYGPVSGNGGAFVPSRPEDHAPPPPYSPPAPANPATSPAPSRDHRNPGLFVRTPSRHEVPSGPQTAQYRGNGNSFDNQQNGWRSGQTPTSAPVLRHGFGDVMNNAPSQASPRRVPPPPPGPPPAASRSGSQAPTTPDRIPPPPPGPPPRDRSSSRSGRASIEGPGRTRFMSTPMETIPSVRGMSPPSPAKRKIEDGPGSSWDMHRSSPKQVDEGTKRREEPEGTNNPWLNGTSDTVSSSRDADSRLGTRSPSVSFNTPQKESSLRKKTASPKNPTLITNSSGKARQQLPTPPPQRSAPSSPEELFSPAVGPSDRSRSKSKQPMEVEQTFLGKTRRRYREMLEAEDASLREEDKLRYFLTFLTKECETRMQIYPETVDTPDYHKLARITAILAGAPEPATSLTPVSPINKADIEDDDDGDDENHPRHWWGNPRNSLERKIQDEESSRGRTSSRWWESSVDTESHAVRSDGRSDGYSHGHGRRRKRRDKATRASLKEIAESMNTPRTAVNPMNPASYMGSAAYPPDRKAQSRSRSRSTAPYSRALSKRPVKTNLDIAPLLTLLPVYPKDYPAVNNAHPSLEVFRNLVRTLNQLDGLKELQNNFTTWQQEHKQTFNDAAVRRRNTQAERVATLYAAPPGRTVDYHAVEQLNVGFEANELQFRTEFLREEFEHFSRTVVETAHRDLHNRINAADAAFKDLQALIEAGTPARDPDSDDPDPPETLEKLTVLKWLFDVREQLHKHIFDLLGQRNQLYKTLCITPLTDTREAEGFFRNDEATRAEKAEKERNQRHNDFVSFVETQVTRGVESARSQYWDIAPLVQESLEKIPESLCNVVPIVPPEDTYERTRRRGAGDVDGDDDVEDTRDTPMGGTQQQQEPMLYLQSKMKFARDACYTVVETQTELLCLLHDAKSRGEVEEERLTRDLKEKVGMVEEEWNAGLGALFDKVQKRVDNEVERRNLGIVPEN